MTGVDIEYVWFFQSDRETCRTTSERDFSILPFDDASGEYGQWRGRRDRPESSR